MNIAFYIDEMNLRGVANSTYQYSFYNQKILKNKSIIFYNIKNLSNKKKVIIKFKKKFKVIGISNFLEIENYKRKLNIKYIYVQKGGERDYWISYKINTLVHSVYPQKLSEVHGFRYAFISEWLSTKFSNDKIPYVPYIVKVEKIKSNLRQILKIKKKQIVFGCHGGESSFDLKFVHDTLIDISNKRKDIVFLFLNIKKFCNHPRIIFLKGTENEIYKKKFLNTCDSMIYGRSLGESFGLACGEFAALNKKIISYQFNRHTSHLFNASKNNFIQYSSRKNLFDILNNFKKDKKLNLNIKNKYLGYSAEKVMKKFDKIFLKNNDIKFSFKDYLINFLSHLIVNYKYIRHKMYSHYYNYFESKFIN
tara:strand:- start:2088 stop:3179 length:1092 start_codon:yes stop_codon:yes gene_type:complete